MSSRIRSGDLVATGLLLSDQGLCDADNAAICGVAVKTIRRWRALYERRGMPRGQAHTSAPCPRCDAAELDEPAYAELLGWYLGDGHIIEGRREVYLLSVINDARYPVLNAHLVDLMRSIKPGGRPHQRRKPGAIITACGWKHWPCLFPQHGPGRKHERPIALEPWQAEIITAHPGPILRGLFHSDGCRIVNWTTKTVAGRVKRYEYPRYFFVNRSPDILGLCSWALDLLGIEHRFSTLESISVAKKAAVTALDEHVGPKS